MVLGRVGHSGVSSDAGFPVSNAVPGACGHAKDKTLSAPERSERGRVASRLSPRRQRATGSGHE
jgi:hypothetical protein